MIVFAELAVTDDDAATIDLSHTATFGITLPDGVGYSSPLAFVGPETTSVPEPPSIAFLASAGLVLLMVHHRPSRPEGS